MENDTTRLFRSSLLRRNSVSRGRLIFEIDVPRPGEEASPNRRQVDLVLRYRKEDVNSFFVENRERDSEASPFKGSWHFVFFGLESHYLWTIDRLSIDIDMDGEARVVAISNRFLRWQVRSAKVE
jgi:hypothetical protein